MTATLDTRFETYKKQEAEFVDWDDPCSIEVYHWIMAMAENQKDEEPERFLATMIDESKKELG